MDLLPIVVDPGSTIAPYEQVRRRIEALALSGDLPAGQRLPPVRRLADDLGLAANTVARAYRELEQGGVVTTRGRHGTFVTLRGADRDRELRIAAQQFAARVHELEADPRTALDVVRELLAD